MNGSIDRECAAQVLIALAVTIGAWMIFVQPKSARLAELEQSIVSYSTTANGAGMPVTQIAEQAGSVRSRMAEIARRNNAAINSSDLYARIGQLAQAHNIVVQTMQPGVQADADKDSGVHTVKIDLSVEGTYVNAAQFLDAISAMSGFVRPVTLSIAPMKRDGSELVSVHYVCELLQFPIPEALAEFRGSSNGV